MSLFNSLGQLWTRRSHAAKSSTLRKRTRLGKRRLRFESLEGRSMLAATDLAGGNQPHENLQSYVALNYVIATEGLFPTQNLGNQPLIGAVEVFAGNFAPVGYAMCDGSLLQIADYSALYAIIGTTYGGNGETTFAVPDLRGRVPVGTGQGPGPSSYVLGQVDGVETVTLGSSNLANHTHTVTGSASPTDATGGSQPFENRQPTLALTPVVALQGIYPSQNLSLEDILGSVHWFAGGFAPRGYALAYGQTLPINQNQALFSLLGTTYGGNGQTTFALPDLRGRMAIGIGGSSNVALGQMGGTETVTPSVANLPSHAHTITGSVDPTGTTGGGQAFDNRQPFLGLNYQIALQGVFPSRPLTAGDSGAAEPVGQGFVSGDVTLDEATARPLIDSLTQEAIRRWQAAGISDTQVAALQAASVVIGDLPSGSLASAGESLITIDRDASNRGWFIDVTPGDNLEFGEIDPRTGELVATDPTAGRHYDLLTALMHEQGHLLGLNHTPLPGQIMYGGLSVGERKLLTAADLVIDGTAPPAEQFLQAEPFVAALGMFAGNFTVRTWASTSGQTLSIAQNTALFSLLGTTYGGDGRTNFALPNTQGRAILGAGQGPGLSLYDLGQTGGQDSVTLLTSEIPGHTHTLPAVSSSADLSVTVTDNVTTAAPGSDLTYTIVVSNAGPSDAQMVSLTDATPTGTTFRSISQNAGPAFTFNNPAVGGTGTITGTAAALTAGTSATFTLVVRVNSSAANNTVVSNTASVSSATTDPTPTNSATDTTTIIVLPSLSINDVTVNEGAGTATFTVSLSAVSGQTVTVNFVSGDDVALAGQDYSAASGTVTFAPGETMKPITVNITDDRLIESNETFFVNLSAPTNATIADSQGLGTITDNDTATLGFTFGTGTALESVGTQNVGVTLTINAIGTGTIGLASNLMANLTTTGGTATSSGTDYTLPASPAVVSFLAGTYATGTSTQNKLIGITDDRQVEGDETAVFGLSIATNIGTQVSVGGTTAHTLTITDNDTAMLGFTAGTSTALESVGTQNVGVTLTINAIGTGLIGLASNLTANLTTTGGTATGGGTDYTLPGSPAVTFLAGTYATGTGTQNAAVPVGDDRQVEGNETAVFGLSIATNIGTQVSVGGTTAHTLTITDNDTATLGFTTGTGTALESVGTQNVGVTLTINAIGTGPIGLASNLTANLTTTGGTATGGGTDYTLPGSPAVTFLAGTYATGTGTQNAAVAIIDDVLDENNETAAFGLSIVTNIGTQGSGGGTTAHTLTITDNDDAPTVTSPTATNISITTATLGGNVTSDGNVPITERGIVYSVTSVNNNPQVGGVSVTKLTTAGTTGVFTINVSALPPGAQISYKAYAKNSVGTSYSPVSTLTTFPNIGQFPGAAVQVFGGNLVITDNASNNQIKILGTATTGQFTVTGLAGTLINGIPNNNLTVQGVSSISVNMNGGTDTVTIDNANLAGGIAIGGGSGIKNILVGVNAPVRVGTFLNINGGTGNGIINVSNATVLGALNITGGTGPSQNTISTISSNITGNLSITGGAGYDLVQQTAVTVGGPWYINVGAGNDLISIANSTANGPAQFISGVGTDKIALGGCRLNAGLLMDGSAGGGVKTLTLYLSTLTGTATLNGGAQNDIVTLTSNTGGNVTVNTNGGNDSVTMDGSDHLAFFASLGDGNDTLTIRGTRVRNTMALYGGAGTNSFTNLGGNTLPAIISRSNI